MTELGDFTNSVGASGKRPPGLRRVVAVVEPDAPDHAAAWEPVTSSQRSRLVQARDLGVVDTDLAEHLVGVLADPRARRAGSPGPWPSNCIGDDDSRAVGDRGAAPCSRSRAPAGR